MSTVSPGLQETKSRSLGRMRNHLSSISRITRSLIAITFATLVLIQLKQWVGNRLGNEAFATGYTLLAVIAALCLLGIRKRLPDVNLGPVSLWQTTHHYLGVFCLITFLMHAGLTATGWLETALAILFWIILGTGFASWYVNRSSPRLLRAAGQATLRSDIPEARVAVAEQAYQLALEAAGSAQAFVIADYYQKTLSGYFSSSRTLFYRVIPTGRYRRDLQYQLGELTRYLDDKGKEMQSQMIKLVQRKDDLDFQSAIHNRIRFFATIHTLFLGAFIVFTVGHVIVAHLYSSHW